MRKNVEELTAEFNRLRMENQGRTFSSKHIYTVLQTIGINKNIAARLCAKGYIESYSKPGTINEREYHFSAAPLHKQQLKNLYDEYNARHYKKKTKLNIEPSIATLKAAGYQIQKPIGFDIEKFQKDHPELYMQYQRYETV